MLSRRMLYRRPKRAPLTALFYLVLGKAMGLETEETRSSDQSCQPNSLIILGSTVLLLTGCIPGFNPYPRLVCRGVCERTPSRAGKMLVSVTSSAILPLFSFLVIGRCVSRDHSCSGRSNNTIKPLGYESSGHLFYWTVQKCNNTSHASIVADQPSGLADRAGSLLSNPEVQQEGLWEK